MRVIVIFDFSETDANSEQADETLEILQDQCEEIRTAYMDCSWYVDDVLDKYGDSVEGKG